MSQPFFHPLSLPTAQSPERSLPEAAIVSSPHPTQAASQKPIALASKAVATGTTHASAAPTALTELLISAPRQHALRLNPPRQPQANPSNAPRARHAHD